MRSLNEWSTPTHLSAGPSDDPRPLPRLLRTPLGAQQDAIRGAALSLERQRGTTVVGEMGAGKRCIGAAAA